MRKSNHPAVRAALRSNPDGLTNEQIRAAISRPDMKQSTMLRLLQAMPDAYVDRWVLGPGSRGQFTSVWCVVVPPANCPHPTDRRDRQQAVATKWVGVQP